MIETDHNSSTHEILSLKGDIETVFEKIKLVREMMEGGMYLEDGLGDVIGFLEACSDRLPDLIKSGSEGTLSEDVFGRVLQLNDALISTLDAEKNNTRIGVADGLSTKAKNSNEKASAMTSTPPVAGKKTIKMVNGKSGAPAALKELTLAEEMAGVTFDTIPLQNSNGNGTHPAMTMSAPAPMIPPKGGSPVRPSNPTTAQPSLDIDLFGDDLMSPFHQQGGQVKTAIPPTPPQKNNDKQNINEEDFDSFLASLK
jgi:hypothetical protein